MLPSNIESEIRNLNKYGKSFKPHKYVALFTAIRLVRNNKCKSNHVYFNESFKKMFSDIFSKYSSDDDRNRSHTPFFHLRTTSFWKLISKPGQEKALNEASTVGGPTALAEIIDYAELSNSFMDILCSDESYLLVESLIHDCLQTGCSNRTGALDKNEDNEFHRIFMMDTGRVFLNPFVSYLNSLHRLGAGNENALAEAQACNPQFAYIHVSHPLTQAILAELKSSNGKHVILTGHAGDGKSTIAVEVYKLLVDIPVDQALSSQLKPREDILDTSITIIKDLSERHKAQDERLLQEFTDGSHRFLLVSNTGTLLDMLRNQAALNKMDEVQLESDVLNAISNERGEADLKFGNTEFRVFNLARMDNLHIARLIFEKMLSPDRWSECEDRDCRIGCPIYMNVDLIRRNQKRVFDQLFLAYRRMYEYGTRLTMRQLTEHLAYLVTSGLEESDIEEMRQKNETPLKSEYMFFNRFFGDNGRAEHLSAQQMQAIREVKKQGFGERPCPTWERRLWLRSHGQKFHLGIKDCDKEFELLREHGSRAGSDNRPGLTPDQAREQVRRMLYFLYDFSKEEKSFLSQYLNSPTILRWQAWQEPHAHLDSNEKFVFEQRIYHVLQEHFTGVRLPEGSTQHDRRLYVTLSRRRSEVRQSAQVVLAQVDWSTATSLNLDAFDNAAGGKRTDLMLRGHDRIEGISLQLTVPFLDYVVMRHFGELGEVLQTAYLERLERFKAQVQKLAGASDGRIMLVRLKTDHTFRRQNYTVCNGTLEVSDVL